MVSGDVLWRLGHLYQWDLHILILKRILMVKQVNHIYLGQDISIPYLHKYWTAEIFRHGCDKYSDAYIFSIIM